MLANDPPTLFFISGNFLHGPLITGLQLHGVLLNTGQKLKQLEFSLLLFHHKCKIPHYIHTFTVLAKKGKPLSITWTVCNFFTYKVALITFL